MTNTFYGHWNIFVEQLSSYIAALMAAGFGNLIRVRITGSLNDGVYAVFSEMISQEHAFIEVTGEEWLLIVERRASDDEPWQIANTGKLSSFTNEEGLVIKLFADRSFLYADENDLTLKCMSLDPSINPFPKTAVPYDFTITEEMLVDE